MKSEKREEIVRIARSYLGTKFVKSGRSRVGGLDCAGLITLIGRDLGLDIKDDLNYTFDPNPKVFFKLVYGQTDAVVQGNFSIGNIGVFKQAIYPMHVGIIAKNDFNQFTVINANINERRVVEEPIEKWRNDLIALRDYRI